MKLPIYMDNQATTPVDPRVLDAMMPYFRDEFGNAASRTHSFGRRAEKAVEEARAKVACLIGAQNAEEIIFTSGATESDNLAIKGAAELYRGKGNHIITTVIEHKAVLDTCRFLETVGFRATYLPVNSEGLIDLDCLRRALDEKTILISVMHANNEIGVIQPIQEVGEIAREHGIFFHSDAVQTIGKIHFDVEQMKIDLASISAHKMYGPKGIGALYVRQRAPRVRLLPVIHGGGHERGLRSGTLNVPAIVGFGKAAELAMEVRDKEATRLLGLRKKLCSGIRNQLDHVYLNGSLDHRVPGNLNLSFEFVDGGSLLNGISGQVAVSSGSACTSASVEPSYVLRALGVKESLIHTSIRFGLGRFNTDEEVDFAIRHVVKVVRGLRAVSPIYEMEQS